MNKIMMTNMTPITIYPGITEIIISQNKPINVLFKGFKSGDVASVMIKNNTALESIKIINNAEFYQSFLWSMPIKTNVVNLTKRKDAVDGIIVHKVGRKYYFTLTMDYK